MLTRVKEHGSFYRNTHAALPGGQIFVQSPREQVAGASQLRIWSGAATPSRRPQSARARTAPAQICRPHMQHHFGIGWGDAPNRALDDGQLPWNLRRQHEELSHTPHPFLTPSQRQHGNVLDAGLEQRPRLSRKPADDYAVKPHEAHFLSWPGTNIYVHRKRHHFKPSVDSRHEVRGELPLTAQLLSSAGSRPAFRTMAITGLQPAGRAGSARW